MAAVTIHSDFGAQENKICHSFHFCPFYLPWADAMILVFWMLNFKPAFLLSSFTLIKSFFNFSSLSAIRVVFISMLSITQQVCGRAKTGSGLHSGSPNFWASVFFSISYPLLWETESFVHFRTWPPTSVSLFHHLLVVSLHFHICKYGNRNDSAILENKWVFVCVCVCVCVCMPDT